MCPKALIDEHQEASLNSDFFIQTKLKDAPSARSSALNAHLNAPLTETFEANFKCVQVKRMFSVQL